MKKIILFFFLLFFIIPHQVFSSSYYYPLENTLQRPQFKKFGQYIDNDFYKNTGNLYPSKYIGYHAGTDLEIFRDEEKEPVPVYAVADGEIQFIGPVTGYGGLILLKTNNNLTFLYGHLNLSEINLKTKDKVYAGQKIAYLGDAFSTQTSGERKHLHFALYNGVGDYFKGYETNQKDLNNNWFDPLKHLENRVAIDPIQHVSPSVIIEKNKNLKNDLVRENIFVSTFNKIILYIKHLF